jgi:hypothetical protein
VGQLFRLYCRVCRRQRPVAAADPDTPYTTGWSCGVSGAPILCERCQEPWSRAHQDTCRAG